MTAITRNRLVWTLGRIVLFTMLALVVEWSGALVKIENVLSTLRIEHCHWRMPPPKTKFAELYRQMAEQCQAAKPADFCGQVIMTEK